MSSVMAATCGLQALTKPLILTGAGAFPRRGRAKGRAVLPNSAAAASTATTAAAEVSTAAATAAAGSTATRALALLLALAREAFGADVAERGLHRIGLVGTAGGAVVTRAAASLRTGPGPLPWRPVATVAAAPLGRALAAAAVRARTRAMGQRIRDRFAGVALRAAVAVAAALAIAVAPAVVLARPLALGPVAVPGGAFAATAGGLEQGLDVALVELHPGAALEPARQHHRAVADADQPADGMADRLEQAPHLAVAALGDGDAVPAVGAFAAALLDGAELRHAVVQPHAFEQPLLLLGTERAEHAHGVFALQAEARMHQLVGEFARTGEQQQAFGIQVEAADRLPLALLQARQLAEHGRPILRVVVRDDLADRLVIGDDARRRRRDPVADRLAIDLDLVAVLDA